MTNRVLFGSYVPGTSGLHRLDPRLKLLTCFWYVILIFAVNSAWGYLFMALCLVGLMILSKVPIRFYWAGIRPLVWVILITVVVQLLFSSGGTTYWRWGILAVTAGGLSQAGVIFCRFILIITASTVLTVTTAPLQLARAIETLMRPLAKLRVPVNQIAMMISIALRFIPTIMDEVMTIMQAQRARGVNFAAGGLLTRAKRLVPIMIPLFVSAFRRAEDLATAMEARGYDPEGERTHYRQLRWQHQDSWALVGVGLATGLFFALRIWIGG